LPEDGGCLVHNVGHRHGNPLLAAREDPLKEIVPDAVNLPDGSLANGLLPPKGGSQTGMSLLPPDKDGVGDAHRGSSAPEREILHLTEPVALLKKLQLLADGIPLADPTGRASRQPSKDGVCVCLGLWLQGGLL
jgi:hypothetical protein